MAARTRKASTSFVISRIFRVTNSLSIIGPPVAGENA
jgi:hypothetical protein